jgi:3-hydroxyisobutyrate dehydrogenase
MMSKPRVALIGLGLMGTGMARRLLGAGFPLTVYNRNPERAAPLADEGAHVAASPREAAARADVVLSMVSDDVAARAVWLGEQGALAGAARGTVLVDCSTVSVAWIEELSRAAAAAGCSLLDAPVTGSKPQAAAGELLFLVGGSADALEIARPALAVMSRAIVHVGATGAGALLKLVNNFLCGVQAAALAEAVAFVERGGLDTRTAFDVLANGAPGSPLVKAFLARMMARDYTPHFHLSLMAKDLAYAERLAERSGAPFRTASAARTEFERAAAAGFGDVDASAVIEVLRQEPGP